MRTPIPSDLIQQRNQYFVDGIIKLDEGEVFVDVGAYIGDTIEQLVSIATKEKVDIKRVVAFEPSDLNYNMLKDACKKYPFVQIVKKGASDKDGTVAFSGSGSVGRVVSDATEDAVSISVARIDSVPLCYEATWIKMDIEGAEMNALRGAKELIVRNHPKLTICIYHSDEDMIRIAEYIHELVPEYKLYIRCHKWDGDESVLYAIP